VNAVALVGVVSVRYIVDDVDAAIAFYTTHLGFDVVMHPAPPFAMLARDDLRLLLSAPSGQGGGGQTLPGGRRPEPGGWNRFQIEVDQVLIEDPSGNPVELFASKPPA
jgi:catechol 2,3-dioxygenase-like lactoylglutathione lyase family enzyme